MGHDGANLDLCGRGSGFDYGCVAVFLVYSLYSKTEEKGTCLVGPGSKYGYYATILQSDYLDDHAHVNIYMHLRICARINIS